VATWAKFQRYTKDYRKMQSNALTLVTRHCRVLEKYGTLPLDYIKQWLLETKITGNKILLVYGFTRVTTIFTAYHKIAKTKSQKYPIKIYLYHKLRS